MWTHVSSCKDLRLQDKSVDSSHFVSALSNKLARGSSHTELGKKVEIELERPSVNYAKYWLDQLFPFPGLVWSGKGFHIGCDHYGVAKSIFMFLAIFGMVTINQPNNRVVKE